MRTFIVRTIIVFVVLGSVMGGFSLAEEPSVTEDANSVQEGVQVVQEQAEAAGEVELETARSDMKAARGKMEAAREAVRQAERKLREAGRRMKESARRQKDAITHHYLDLVQTEHDDSACEHGSDLAGLLANVSNLTNRTQSGRGERILVIPGGQIKWEELGTIMEDMNVMSRIFGKRLLEARMISGGGYGRGGYGGGMYGGGIYSQHGGYGGYGGYGVGTLFGGDGCRTAEGIYIDGYGALFLMRVDFPLSAPAERQEEGGPEEPTDRVWDETRRQMYSPEGVRLERRGGRGAARGGSEKEYDAEKVEELKRTLVKALKHASNIRALEPEQWVVATVMGSGEPRNVSMVVVKRTGSVIVSDKDRNVTKVYAGAVPSDVAFSSPTVMTIRVKKSDVDAFAAGELDFENFREKVQIFTY
jgi:hypothetical protein